MVKGYVVAGDKKQTGDEIVWKVRVQDETSPHNGKKLIVASVHNHIELARGLKVTFEIGCVDAPEGQPNLRAVDVRLQVPEGHKGQKELR